MFGICELVLETADIEALECFYTRLGMTVLAREDGRVWLVEEGVGALADD
jgi:hypothetical protein